MLIARVAPPIPDGALPQQVPLQLPATQKVVEILAPPGALLIRRLVADLTSLGFEVAWARPQGFEPDSSSLAPLLLLALSVAHRSSPGGKQPVVVIESPSTQQAAHAESLLGQLLSHEVPGISAPSVILVVDARHRADVANDNDVQIEVPSWPVRLVRALAPGQERSNVSLRQLSRAADGMAGLIEGALRTVPQFGAAEFTRITSKAHEPAALTRALTSGLLSGASAERLAALEMAGHLGYAHARLGSLEPALAVSASHPWWVPLTDGWLQVDTAWQAALVANAAPRAGVTARSACLNRLVAELIDQSAIHEAIELSINAGWRGLAADLLAGEAEQLMSSGQQAALARWLDRLPIEEVRSHRSLVAAVDHFPSRPGEQGPVNAHQPSELPPPAPRRRWPFRRSGRRPSAASEAAGISRGRDCGTDKDVDRTASPSMQPAAGGAALLGRPALALVQGAPEATVGDRRSRPHTQGHRAASVSVRVEARLLGPLEIHIDGRQVVRWQGNRGRMVLAYLLLHCDRPVDRDVLGGVFWPDAAPDVVRNRLHVALYGLRRDLRRLSEHPIVVHGRGGFSLDPELGLWLDTEAFDEAVSAARTQEEAGRTQAALACYETAIGLYRGELLEDTPFEEWTLLGREQTHVRYVGALDRVATLRFKVGRYADCVGVCQQLAARDVYREDVTRLLMRCFARLNQPHLAVREYQLCERQLRGELGLEPADATQRLYHQIRRRQPV
jgi:DNA-binding SARP family transcriptional activator